MGPQNPADSPLRTVPTAQAFESKLRSVWDVPLPSERPLKDLSELTRVLDDHEKWVRSLEDPATPLAGCRAVLKNVDLRGVSFSRRDLRAADFSGANLEGANLEGCLLTLACFKGANLKNADLRGAKIKKADLTDALVEGVQL